MPKQSSHIILRGALLGVLLFVVTLAVFVSVLPQQNSHDESKNYGYVYSGIKSQSIAFNTAADAENSVFLFGSSELSTPSSLIAQVPSEVFGTNNYGLNLTYIGEAYDQSLWHAMAIAAYSSSVREDGKIVIIASPAWFEDEGLDESTFQMRFSYSLYRAFCENSSISSSSKTYLASRLKDFGIDETTINAGQGTTIADKINNAIYLWADDIKLRKDLIEVRENGLPLVSSEEEIPDFKTLYKEALEDAQANSTNNTWGMDDEFYANNIEQNLYRLPGTQSNEHFANSDELKDFSFMLKVCKELDLDPLVIIPPVHGEFYDYAGSSSEDRQACYSKMVALCQANNIQYADFTDKEYEPYFLHDIVHFGNTGWVNVEESIYSFVTGSNLNDGSNE
jgi:D-alanine transfer protein